MSVSDDDDVRFRVRHPGLYAAPIALAWGGVSGYLTCFAMMAMGEPPLERIPVLAAAVVVSAAVAWPTWGWMESRIEYRVTPTSLQILGPMGLIQHCERADVLKTSTRRITFMVWSWETVVVTIRAAEVRGRREIRLPMVTNAHELVSALERTPTGDEGVVTAT